MSYVNPSVKFSSVSELFVKKNLTSYVGVSETMHLANIISTLSKYIILVCNRRTIFLYDVMIKRRSSSLPHPSSPDVIVSYNDCI
jgi:hypothetical protein